MKQDSRSQALPRAIIRNDFESYLGVEDGANTCRVQHVFTCKGVIALTDRTEESRKGSFAPSWHRRNEAGLRSAEYRYNMTSICLPEQVPREVAAKA
jgi:hypothetical protein